MPTPSPSLPTLPPVMARRPGRSRRVDGSGVVAVLLALTALPGWARDLQATPSDGTVLAGSATAFQVGPADTAALPRSATALPAASADTAARAVATADTTGPRPAHPAPGAGVEVGSEADRYLRALQVAGITSPRPWTLREMTAWETARALPYAEAPHPWAGYAALQPKGGPEPSWGWIAPREELLYNSTFPWGENDGALWAGKGMTGAVQGGFWGRVGAVRLRIAPVLFWAQNAAFPLAPNGLDGEAALRDSRFPGGIDHPQRFGDEAYARLDPGASSLVLELPGIATGVSTAAQWWGPTQHYPLMLGNNAGGFPHAFVRTARPLDLWLFRLHALLLGGRLDQSDLSPVVDGEERRFASAAAVVLLPRGLEGLEVGVARFSESVWPEGGIGLDDLLRPFSDLISAGGEGNNPRDENQLAGAFFRWVLPSAGFEAYMEILREDFARDLRHYLVEPDDLLARTFGFQRVWRRGPHRLTALRGEMVSSELHHSERGDRFRDGQPPRPYPRYVHGGVRQGHTQRGQILGAPAAYGGSGWTVGVDHYHPGGRWSLDLSRALRLDWLPEEPGPGGANRAAVLYTLRGELVAFRGKQEWSVMVAPGYELNRNLVEGNDVFNLGLGLSVRGFPW